MSVETESNPAAPRDGASTKPVRRRRKPSVGSAMLARGEPMIWLTGGALAICLLMIISLLGGVIYLGVGTFYPVEVVRVTLQNGKVHMGEITKTESFSLDAQSLVAEPEPIFEAALGKFIDELGESSQVVAEIPTSLEQLNVEAAERQTYLEEKLARVEAKVEALREALATEQTSAFAKAEHIRKIGAIEEFDDQHGFMLTISNELAATKLRQEVNGKAIEYFRQSASQADNLVTAIVDAPYEEKVAGVEALLRMKAAADGTKVAMDRRWQFRTGNYQMTGTHFNWVSDYQIKPEEVAAEEEPDSLTDLPEWSMVIERLTWGRFYGMPKRFELSRERPLPREEAELIAMEKFFNANLTRIDSESTRQAVEMQLAAAQEKLAPARREAVVAFLADVGKSTETEKIAVTADGIRIATAELEPTADVRALIEVYQGDQAAYRQFTEYHPAARERYFERRSLEKHDIGAANALVEEARLSVRAAEISENQEGSLELARQLSDLKRQLGAFQQTIIDAEQVAAQIQKRYGKSELATAATTIVAKLKQENSDFTAPVREQRDLLLKEIAEYPEAMRQAVHEFVDVSLDYQNATSEIQARINEIEEENKHYQLVMETAQGDEKPIELGEIVRAYPANQLSLGDKANIYLSRVWEFLSEKPREANSEGGVFPAIWGTVAMTLIMSLVVAPFGVLAALFLREYAKAGPVVSVIRISINNLAGVPSIVFGVFGLAFFCYGAGKWIDGGPTNLGLSPIQIGWWLVLLTVPALIAVGAFVCGMIASAGHPGTNRKFKRVIRFLSFGMWMGATFVFIWMIVLFPFNGFYSERLPESFFGTGGVMWASLTLALLTLPVVIVATEEALSAVPNSMREGSYGCGASKWQTIRRIVLPHALPGIMTGMILAMARGAGEVAPLMLVGAMKLVPELPVDSMAPFIHLERKFMHLGFHIFDLGFQSQNSEAAKPMVFTTTLLLIAIIACLNIAAVWLRSVLRRRFQSGNF